MDNYPYWLSSSAIIFGNSGGAVFLKETREFIGVPSRVAVNIMGFSAQAVTHMAFFIPITSIYQFLDDEIFQFIYDDNYTSAECEEIRNDRREKDQFAQSTREEKNGNGRSGGEVY